MLAGEFNHTDRESSRVEGVHCVIIFEKNDPWEVGRAKTYLTEMCSGSEAGSYLRLIDFVYHSTLGLRVINKKRPCWLARSIMRRTERRRRVAFSDLSPAQIWFRVHGAGFRGLRCRVEGLQRRG